MSLGDLRNAADDVELRNDDLRSRIEKLEELIGIAEEDVKTMRKKNRSKDELNQNSVSAVPISSTLVNPFSVEKRIVMMDSKAEDMRKRANEALFSNEKIKEEINQLRKRKKQYLDILRSSQIELDALDELIHKNEILVEKHYKLRDQTQLQIAKVQNKEATREEDFKVLYSSTSFIILFSSTYFKSLSL